MAGYWEDELDGGNDMLTLIAGINALYPTLLSPNSSMVGIYWAVLYTLQSGSLSYLVRITRKDAGAGEQC